jgi:hypothetical protein
MKKMTLLTFATLVALTGCEKESEQKPASFYNQKYSTVLTYEQTEQKFSYQDCLAKNRETHTEGECRVPDFLKK